MAKLPGRNHVMTVALGEVSDDVVVNGETVMPATSTVTVFIQRRDTFTADYRVDLMVEFTGELVVSGLSIYRAPTSPPITSTLLRDFDVGAVLNQVAILLVHK